MKIDRMLSIIMILLERRRVSIPQLAELCEVSTRTISRDLEAINQAGIPLVAFPGANGGVEIMENYKLEKRIFSTADVTTLLMGLGCIRSTLTGPEVAAALAKVRGFIPEAQRGEIELKAGRIAIDLTPWVGRSECAALIDAVQEALERNRLVRFRYVDRMRNETERTVEPYRLVLKGMQWYLDGYCLDRQAYRLFKLSRIADLVVTGQSFEPRDYHPDPVVSPAFRDEGLVMVDVRVNDRALDRLEETLVPEQLDEQEAGPWRTVRIPLTDDERGYRYLLSFGHDCLCIGPESVRQGMRAYVEELADRYRNTIIREIG